MSRYTVVRWPAALDELTELGLQSDERAAITGDAREVDHRLAEQASEWGDHVTDNVSVMELTRIGVYFRLFRTGPSHRGCWGVCSFGSWPLAPSTVYCLPPSYPPNHSRCRLS